MTTEPSTTPPRPRRGHLPHPPWLRSFRQVATLVLLLIAFYVTPITGREESIAARIGGLVVVGALLAAVVTSQLRHHSEDPVGRLITVLAFVVVTLAALCYALATSSPHEFSGLDTRTDALYFTIVTMTTIGYGDIHASGQVSRWFVIFMIAFDVVFVSALASTIGSRFRLTGGHRAADHPAPAEDPRDA